MWYSIITTGKVLVTQSSRQVDRIKRMYLYPKIRTHASAEEADEFVRVAGYKEAIKRIRNYGNTIKGFTIHVRYKIMKDCLYIIYDTQDIGELYIKENKAYNSTVERTGTQTKIKYEIELNNNSIDAHIKAIQLAVMSLGNLFCINVHIPYFGVFYALTTFPRNGSGSSRLSSFLYADEMLGVAYSYGDYQEETQ